VPVTWLYFVMLLFDSSTVHLLAAHRPKSRWSSCTGDCTHVQDGQGSVQPAGEGLDTQVCHVVPDRDCAHSRSPASSSCIHHLFVVDTLFIIASTLCVLIRTLVCMYVCVWVIAAWWVVPVVLSLSRHTTHSLLDVLWCNISAVNAS